MKDVRKAAEERASRPREKPIGASFETEHQRQKKALVKQIDSLDPGSIRKIAATAEENDENRILRVAAYCRVSTDDLDQALSIAMQIRAYKELIKANPKWKYVGTYVDDGFSGTNTDHRQGFQKLMQDAMDGKIDLIITKAVSRFARNMLDCLGWIEKLQQLDPPVSVYFEQEKIDTMAPTSGVILVVLAMVAQEESHMKSEAILLSLEWRFSRGRFLTPRLFGYNTEYVPDGYGGQKKVLRINESEARVVRWMYYSLLEGASPEEIADVLTELAIPTGGRKKDGTFNTHWSPSHVLSVLRNERLCGDILARKTYTTDYKTHISKKNNGKKNKYFKADHHKAIVSRSVWNAAQRILNSRRFGHEGYYLPMRIIDDGILSGFISMNRSWAGFDAEDYYQASQIAMGLLDESLEANLEKEYLPEGGKRSKGLLDDHGIGQIARELTEAEQKIKDELEGKIVQDQEIREREETAKTFQVVSGELFSHITDPVLRISTNSIVFNSKCVSKMNCCFAEILFNPVERMLILRPCAEDHPNAIPWNSRPLGASCLCKVFYETLDWEPDYSYRIPCQVITSPDGKMDVLAFDLDNYIGRAINKKEEVIIARKEEELATEQRENAKSYYFPPDDDEEPQEIHDMEERFQKALEANRKIFGTPTFQHSSDLREFTSGDGNAESWEMLKEARPLDISHRMESQKIEALLSEIRENPPDLPRSHRVYEADNDIILSDAVVTEVREAEPFIGEIPTDDPPPQY